MICRIALTLGMGVAVMTAGSRIVPSRVAATATSSLTAVAGAQTASQVTPRGSHRSGYIVASS